MKRNRPSGFTMIELMIVVAIIGILAAIALPKFADYLEKSREGATKGNVGVLRSANFIYYGDNPGIWPTTLNATSPYRYSMYIDAIPMVKVTGKFDAASTGFSPVGSIISLVSGGAVPSTRSSGWMYDSSIGGMYVNSTLRDSKQIPYSFYGFE